MSSNSQILNIINDIEELKDETTTLNNNVYTINNNIQILEDTKQNNITVLDTIQIFKLKSQYITMTLTGQDLQSTLTILNGDIIALQGRLDTEEPKITALETLTATHTSQVSSNDTDVLALPGRLNTEEPKITALKTLTATHTSQISENKAFTVDLRKNKRKIVNRCKRLDVGTGRFTKFKLTTLVYMEVGDFLHIRVESGTAYLESLKQTCIFGYLLG